MAALIEMREQGVPNLVESGELAALGATPWVALTGMGEHVFTCDIDDVASATGTFVVEKRRVRKDGTYGSVQTIFTSATLSDFPQIGRLAGFWEVRLRCSVYTSGTFNLAIAK